MYNLQKLAVLSMCILLHTPSKLARKRNPAERTHKRATEMHRYALKAGNA